MSSCLFCNIANGTIPSNKLFEDEHFFAILDIGPINKGHTLVVPRKHSETFLHMDEFELGKMMILIQRISRAVVKATNADGFNLILNNSKAAGQAIDHSHFHIIPRFYDDGFKHWQHKHYENGEAQKIASVIRKFL